jgi:4-hydroxy-tetrahydrodipicolinate synthase
MTRKKIPFELKGVGCLPIPFFTKDDKINVEEFKRHIEWLIENDVHTIVPGSMVKWMNPDEKRLVWEAAIDAAGNKAAVMPCVGTDVMNTKQAVQELKMAEETGANSLFTEVRAVRFQYYVLRLWPALTWPKHFEEAAYQFFKAMCEATDLPILIYNHAMPDTTNIPVNFMVRLAQDFENFSGLKTNNSATWYAPASQLPYEIRALKPFGINVAKGTIEIEYVAALLHGCDGFIAPMGHVFPDRLNDLYNAFHAGDLKKAVKLQDDFLDLCSIILESGNYWGTKFYLPEALGFEVGKPRPPLYPLSEDHRKQIDKILKDWGVYKKYTYHKA